MYIHQKFFFVQVIYLCQTFVSIMENRRGVFIEIYILDEICPMTLFKSFIFQIHVKEIHKEQELLIQHSYDNLSKIWD